MSGILYNSYAVLRSQFENSSHVAGQATIMDRRNRFGARTNRLTNSFGTNIQRNRIDIDEFRNAAKVTNDFCCSRKGHCWNDNLITWRYADRFHRKMKPSSRRVDGNCLGTIAKHFFKPVFEFPAFLTGC